MLYIENLDIKSILSNGTSTDKFWYVVHQDRTFAGYIDSRDYSQICETKKMVVKKDFLYVHVWRKM